MWGSEYGETGYESIKKIIEQDQDICLGESITIYNDHFKGMLIMDILNFKLLFYKEIETEKILLSWLDRSQHCFFLQIKIMKTLYTS